MSNYCDVCIEEGHLYNIGRPYIKGNTQYDPHRSVDNIKGRLANSLLEKGLQGKLSPPCPRSTCRTSTRGPSRQKVDVKFTLKPKGWREAQRIPEGYRRYNSTQVPDPMTYSMPQTPTVDHYGVDRYTDIPGQDRDEYKDMEGVNTSPSASSRTRASHLKASKPNDNTMDNNDDDERPLSARKMAAQRKDYDYLRPDMHRYIPADRRQQCRIKMDGYIYNDPQGIVNSIMSSPARQVSPRSTPKQSPTIDGRLRRDEWGRAGMEHSNQFGVRHAQSPSRLAGSMRKGDGYHNPRQVAPTLASRQGGNREYESYPYTDNYGRGSGYCSYQEGGPDGDGTSSLYSGSEESDSAGYRQKNSKRTADRHTSYNTSNVRTVEYVELLRQGFFALCDAVKEDMAHFRATQNKLIEEKVKEHVAAALESAKREASARQVIEGENWIGGMSSVTRDMGEQGNRVGNRGNRESIGLSSQPRSNQDTPSQEVVDNPNSTGVVTQKEFSELCQSFDKFRVSVRSEVMLETESRKNAIVAVKEQMRKIMIQLEILEKRNQSLTTQSTEASSAAVPLQQTQEINKLKKQLEGTITDTVMSNINPHIDHVKRLTGAYQGVQSAMLDDVLAKSEGSTKAVIANVESRVETVEGGLKQLRADTRTSLQNVCNLVGCAMPDI
eukprot:Tbor_TRINITY_DN4881_c0_g2::TRINITY_DN4881_c0_g2_i1::g.1257::m.1257